VKPRVFIGSSREGLKLAEAIQRNLEYDAHCTVWPQAVFNPGGITIGDMLAAVSTNDFGVFVCSPDDIAAIRSHTHAIPRDNVLLEAGMFLGRYGLARSFLVVPRDVPDFRMPTDLLGVTLADYESKRLKTDIPDATLGTACSQIKTAIQRVENPPKQSSIRGESQRWANGQIPSKSDYRNLQQKPV
jgi:predicted nucleotide-binding protein